MPVDYESDTLPMQDHQAIQAALSDLDTGRSIGSLSRKNSTCSHASCRSGRWSSGKALPPPPPPKSGRVRDFFTSRWRDRRKRRLWMMWILFILVLLFTVILALVLIGRFTSAFSDDTSSPPRLTQEEQKARNPSLKLTTPTDDSSKPGRKGELLLLIGGFVGPGIGGPKFTEIISHQGSCNLPEGFPAILPDIRIGQVSASFGQTIITCGGAGIIDSQIQNAEKTCWAYSPVSNSWAMLRTSMPFPVAYASAASLGSDFWVFGGNDDNGKKSSVVQVLNTITQNWKIVKPSLPFEIWGHCAVKIKFFSAILVTGGWSQERNSLESAMYLSPNEGSNPQWITLPRMNEGRATHGCAATKYKDSYTAVVVAGGMGGHNGPLNSVEILPLTQSLTTTGWIKMPNLLKRRSWYPSVAVLSKKLIVAGGKNLYGNGEDSLEEYISSQQSWKLVDAKLRQSRYGGQSVQISGSLFPNCLT